MTEFAAPEGRRPAIIHPQALCESSAVGSDTHVWAFAHILPGARIGAECNICDGVFIEGDVVIGDRVTVKCGVQLWDGTRIGDDVFVGPNATFTNDAFPRSKRPRVEVPPIVIESGASLGANCTVLPGVRIGRNAMIGAGAVVTSDVPANAIVAGNPARIQGYVDAGEVERAGSEEEHFGDSARVLPVGNARIVPLLRATDMRGTLVAMDFAEVAPFTVRRTFFVYDVPSEKIRGEHAHRTCHQLLVCVRGSVAVLLDDGNKRSQVLLDTSDRALYVPPMIWACQYRYTADAVLFVLASEPYNPSDYIRDYEEFIRASRADSSTVR
jgi:UDP-2-acetamido-3-amino-2,3-dideoxy-glucuronate N-acetyltransferase